MRLPAPGVPDGVVDAAEAPEDADSEALDAAEEAEWEALDSAEVVVALLLAAVEAAPVAEPVALVVELPEAVDGQPAEAGYDTESIWLVGR